MSKISFPLVGTMIWKSCMFQMSADRNDRREKPYTEDTSYKTLLAREMDFGCKENILSHALGQLGKYKFQILYFTQQPKKSLLSGSHMLYMGWLGGESRKMGQVKSLRQREPCQLKKKQTQPLSHGPQYSLYYRLLNLLSTLPTKKASFCI